MKKDDSTIKGNRLSLEDIQLVIDKLKEDKNIKFLNWNME